jgi:hypothetical protein
VLIHLGEHSFPAKRVSILATETARTGWTLVLTTHRPNASLRITRRWESNQEETTSLPGPCQVSSLRWSETNERAKSR